jgi:ATP-dependent DNA helicase UvrD/PcrA
VAMTRARDELVLSSAADYGSGRPRKVSRFVVEALDLPSPAPVARRAQPLEALARNAAAPPAAAAGIGSRAEGARINEAGSWHKPLRLSFAQMDDYLTCPLKYRYVHVLRVPLLAHHRVVYGSAVHKAVQRYFQARLEGAQPTEDDLLAAFRGAWVSEGFLSREHEEERLRAGEEALRRFHRQDTEHPLRPTAVEQEFAFMVGATRVVGRYDLVLQTSSGATILDFKTGAVDDEKKAAQRARESLQLDVYALAWLRTTGRLPDRLELRFLETGLSGSKVPTLEEAARTEAAIVEVAAALRRQEFPARPSYMACGQCAFRDICPYTARAPEA